MNQFKVAIPWTNYQFCSDEASFRETHEDEKDDAKSSGLESSGSKCICPVQVEGGNQYLIWNEYLAF